MLPLDRLSPTEARGLDGLLFDLDDTLLDHGKLREAAFAALFRLAESGLRLIALTGRPLSFADFIARTWPVSGAIAENGAVAVSLVDGRPTLIDTVAPYEREERRNRLAGLRGEILAACPELRLTDDAHFRHSDVTFDIGEHESPSPESIERATSLGRDKGARVTRSSIHLHFSFDRHDKATGALAFLQTRFGDDPTRARARFAFVGDSDNDSPAFAAFRTTFGVANLKLRSGLFPRYRTSGERGTGFVELAETLVRLRRP